MNSLKRSLSPELPRKVEKEPCSAEPAQEHVGGLHREEDHEEAACDGEGGHHRLEVRAEPFS